LRQGRGDFPGGVAINTLGEVREGNAAIGTDRAAARAVGPILDVNLENIGAGHRVESHRVARFGVAVGEQGFLDLGPVTGTASQQANQTDTSPKR
jgi:hypothetical protein